MRGGGNVVMTVIDGTGNRHAVHDPAYCFSGAGWKILSRSPITLSSGTATHVLLKKENQESQAFWFFDDKKTQFTSPLEYWMKSAMRRATLGWSGAEPVLVTIQSIPGDTIKWERVRQILLPALGFH